MTHAKVSLVALAVGAGQALNEQKWIPRSHVAKALGVSRKTIFRWTYDAGCTDFPSSFRVGGQAFYLRDEILAWKATRESKRAPQLRVVG